MNGPGRLGSRDAVARGDCVERDENGHPLLFARRTYERAGNTDEHGRMVAAAQTEGTDLVPEAIGAFIQDFTDNTSNTVANF